MDAVKNNDKNPIDESSDQYVGKKTVASSSLNQKQMNVTPDHLLNSKI